MLEWLKDEARLGGEHKDMRSAWQLSDVITVLQGFSEMLRPVAELKRKFQVFWQAPGTRLKLVK